ncbi:TonB-dependent receptor plug domain-containing protein [Mucilaginibacter sp. JRF]|uniref:TonB-dependent receptor plug domain-containing protein n=1 Tax=Mucilaginibacter sp. JRF TaxID=2780088 RepID=UPI0018805629|nr:TonB-dependent receptor plug domain-containing protein [Mucilaginibacter sp. JRF]MBE9586447.1 TonB-dependent receptor plug domain-containing protein [Mucilaginibacter sp. JRF]
MKLLPKFIWKTVFLLLVCFGWTMNVYAQDTLKVDSVVSSNRGGVDNILLGNVAGLRVKSWSGTPSVQSTLNLRGLSLDPTDRSTMPLILVDGVPMIASPSDVTGINPLNYYSADQIERIEVIKQIDLLSAYGVQAPNGAINIIMKEGKQGAIHVNGNAFAGANFLPNMDHGKDAFYDFNTMARRDVYGNGGVVNEQNVMVDGAGDFGSYLFGLSNYQDKGYIKDSGFSRQSLFLNAKYNITKKFSAHFYNNLSLANRNGRYAGEFSRELLLPVVNDEGFVMDKNRNVGLLSFMGLTYQFNPAFKAVSTASLSYEAASRDMYLPSTVLDGDIYASSVSAKRQLISLKTYVNYIHKFSDALKMDMSIGNEIRTNDDRITSVNGSRSLENGGSNYVKVVTGYNATQTNAYSDHEIEKIVSFYGTWKWNYKEDLDVNMVLRTDGSSFYQNKWALYPAVGVHYNLKNTLNFPVKVNVAYGKTGILSRPEVYRGQIGGYGDYYGGNELGVGILYPAFQDAKSVGVYQFDAGLSFAVNPALNFSVNYFNKIYKDFTYQRYLPNISGIDYEYETGGSLGLAGVEFNLDGNWIHTRNFSWATNVNLAVYKNKVRELPNDIGNTSLAYLSALTKGDAVTSLVAYEGTQQKVIGNSEAKGFGGVSNTLRYKNISASMTVSYAWGADVAAESFTSTYYADQVNNVFPLKSAETPYYTTSTDATGRTIYQGISNIEKGSFIRLNKAAITYHFGTLLKKAASINDMQLFVRGDNLITLSKYSGINPEENITGVRRRDLIYTGTPLPSSIVLGLKLVL